LQGGDQTLGQQDNYFPDDPSQEEGVEISDLNLIEL
jgi:hypothetical protein